MITYHEKNPMKFLSILFGTKHQRDIKGMMGTVRAINQLESQFKATSDDALKAAFTALREEYHRDKKPLKFYLPRVFAIVREVARRTLGMRHFDVQLIGGIVLFEGKIAEMKTGEGKTLVATLTATLRSLANKGVHIVTVNDHLAKRDANWMGPIYHYLGLSVGTIVHGISHEQRRQMYQCDITYGTNNEFGFDYLRDNMVDDLSMKVQNHHYFCIIDEVDSILVDEARTPLIISGPSDSDTEKYYKIDKITPRLQKADADEKGKEIPNTGDFLINIKDRNLVLTEEGVHKLEGILHLDNLYDPENMELLHHINQSLKSHHLYEQNVDYIVEGGEVVIIDEFTGRKMEGRRFSDGLHQAIEAKEGVTILRENQTLASITFQNYFRMYDFISGMTGTADTEAEEFKKIYGLEVICIPTNAKVNRIDQNDKIYRTEKEKFDAITNLAYERHHKGIPILVGTSSVEVSEALSKVFQKKGLPHEVLNAKNHEREAHIIASAGQKGAITIATNMAGRGTDIKLGDGVKTLGGLLVLGSERHESRRIDNQLRGRSGRQGDAGTSLFYLSLEDTLMKRFGSQRISKMMLNLGMEKGQEIENRFISHAIQTAQEKVETINFEIRKYLLEYDDVMNKQRTFIYKERGDILHGKQLSQKIEDYLDEAFTEQCFLFSNQTQKTFESLYHKISIYFKNTLLMEMPLPLETFLQNPYQKNEDLLYDHLVTQYHQKRKQYPPELFESVEKFILLQTIDNKWKDHLLQMDHLREGINLRSYGEKKPLNEFKREGFKMFKAMLMVIYQEVIEKLFQVKTIRVPEHLASQYNVQNEEANTQLFSTTPQSTPQNQSSPSARMTRTQVRAPQKIGRNEPCYCGSSKKYKHCHGKL